MPYLKQGLILFSICIVAQVVAELLPIAIPASVLAMGLLFAFLTMKFIKREQVGVFGDFLVKNMGFFFIPPGVAVIEQLNVVSGKVLEVLAVMILTTFLTYGATGWTVATVIRLQEKWGKRHE